MGIMGMDIVSEQIDGIVVLKISGHFDASGASAVERFLQPADIEPSPQIIVDLSSVDFLDSIALAALVIGLKRYRQQNGQLVLCGIPPIVRVIFEVAFLEKVFPLFATPEEAIASLRTQKADASLKCASNDPPLAPFVNVKCEVPTQKAGASPNRTRTDALLIESLRDNRENIMLRASMWLERGYRAYGLWGEELLFCWPASAWDEMARLKESDVTLSTPIKAGEQMIGRIVLIGGTRTPIAQALFDAYGDLVSTYYTMKTRFAQATEDLIAQAQLRTEIDVAARI